MSVKIEELIDQLLECKSRQVMATHHRSQLMSASFYEAVEQDSLDRLAQARMALIRECSLPTGRSRSTKDTEGQGKTKGCCSDR